MNSLETPLKNITILLGLFEIEFYVYMLAIVLNIGGRKAAFVN